MKNKDVIIGIIVGLIANAIGLYFAAMLLGNGDDPFIVIKAANAEGFLGKLMSLGAILNLVTFFIYIRKRKDKKAKGVLLATILIAVFTFVIRF